jgi:hypothetical protein
MVSINISIAVGQAADLPALISVLRPGTTGEEQQLILVPLVCARLLGCPAGALVI